MLRASVTNSLDHLTHLLKQLSDQDFSQKHLALSNATIGEHTRHIVEMFQCLLNEYDTGVINYDNRKRNLLIQSQVAEAIEAIDEIRKNLKIEDKDLIVEQIIEGEEYKIASNYYRELLYNFEHCIHHQALIKVAVLEFKHITVDAHFGVARSTIEYRNQCAQ